MFTQSRYFFEPLINEEIDLIAQNSSERKLMLRVVLNRLIFVFFSQTKKSQHPELLDLLTKKLHDDHLMTDLAQLNPEINSELIERSLAHVLQNIQSRLENQA